jgi:hypothetical protein
MTTPMPRACACAQQFVEVGQRAVLGSMAR